MWTLVYYSQQFISNLPFFGQIFSDYIWGDNSSLSKDILESHQRFSQLIFAGGLGASIGRSILEIWFQDFDFVKVPAIAEGLGGDLDDKIPISIKPLDTLAMTGSGSGSSKVPGEGLSKVPGEGLEKEEFTPKNTPFYLYILESFKTEFLVCNQSYVDFLKRISDNNLSDFTLEILNENKILGDSNMTAAEAFWGILDNQANILGKSFTIRELLLNDLRRFLSEEDQTKIDEILLRKEEVTEDYVNKIDDLGRTKLSDGLNKNNLKLFFNLTNEYRNSVRKELSKAEVIIQKGIKQSWVFKEPEFKKMVNIDYPQANKAFNDQDGYLKKKVSEILNESKIKK